MNVHASSSLIDPPAVLYAEVRSEGTDRIDDKNIDEAFLQLDSQSGTCT